VKQVRMYRDGEETVILENYSPAAYMLDLIDSSAVTA